VFLSPLLGDGALRWYPIFRLGDLISAVAGGHPVSGADLAPVASGLMFLVLCLCFAGFRLSRQELQ
jgi:hypothetical protein